MKQDSMAAIEQRVEALERRLAALGDGVLISPVNRCDRAGVAERAKVLVAARFGITVETLVCRLRTDRVVLPRFIAIHLVRKYTDMTLGEIGAVFKRDHGSILHALKVLPGWVVSRQNLRGMVEDIEKQFAGLLV